MSEWKTIDSAPKGEFVMLEYDWPENSKRRGEPVLGIYRQGWFWGRQTEGWFAQAEGGGMWVDAWVKGWRPRNDGDPLPEPPK